MVRVKKLAFASVVSLMFFGSALSPSASAEKKPNILVIMGDDVGWFNIGAYHRGMMSGKTPNLDKLAPGGMIFTDYYAEASCTAGRAKFHHRRNPIAHRSDHSGSGRSRCGPPGSGRNHCAGPQSPGL